MTFTMRDENILKIKINMEVEIRAFESLRLDGIDDNMFYQSPFDLTV